MSNTNVAVYNANISSLAKQGSESDCSKIFMQFSVDDKDSNKSVVNTIFQNNYGQNFDGHTTQIICSAENNQLLNYSCTFDGFEISKKAVLCTTLNYTNENKRFECICIELLKVREKKDELFKPDWANGCVFLPDVFGDKIIEKCPQYSSYDDILLNNTPFYIYDDNGKQAPYKIANFFHVNGFNNNYISSGESYLESDYKFGTMLSWYLGDYILTTDNSLFSAPSRSLVIMDDSKRFQIDYDLNCVCNYAKNCLVDAKYFRIKNSEAQQISGFEELIDSKMNGAKRNELFYILCFTFLLVAILLSCFLSFYNFSFFSKTTLSFFIVDIVLLFLGSGIVEFLKSSFLGSSIPFLSIFSLYYGLVLLIEFICLILVLIRWLYVKKN